jgi:hypothetical protein
VTASPSAQSTSRMERSVPCPTVPDETTVALESVAACLEVGFDARTGTVTAKVVDPRDGRPIPLRAEPLNLYAPFERGSNGATEGARVSLHPVDPATDSDGVLRATLFTGESRRHPGGSVTPPTDGRRQRPTAGRNRSSGRGDRPCDPRGHRGAAPYTCAAWRQCVISGSPCGRCVSTRSSARRWS